MKGNVKSYTIKALNITIKLNDCVLMRSANPDRHPLDVAQVERIQIVNKFNVNIHIRWYYWPDDLENGRLRFHGDKELFISDHQDVQSVHTIAGICKVHTLQVYNSLKIVEEEDFFYRFEYIAAEKRLKDVLVEVYCMCEMPYNPDLPMVQCDECKDWFHADCIDMMNADIQKVKHFLCPDCSFDSAAKRSMNLIAEAPSRSAKIGAVVSATKAKVGSKRRKVYDDNKYSCGHESL